MMGEEGILVLTCLPISNIWSQHLSRIPVDEEGGGGDTPEIGRAEGGDRMVTCIQQVGLNTQPVT